MTTAIRPRCRADIVGPGKAYDEFLRDTEHLRARARQLVLDHASRMVPKVTLFLDKLELAQPEIPRDLQRSLCQIQELLRAEAVKYFGDNVR